jgi:hypothetical protein
MDVRSAARATLLASSLVAATAPSSAGTVSLAWDPVPAPDLAGYRVYHGPASRTYTAQSDVGLQTATTLTGLADCTTHHFAVKAYDTEGLESVEHSDEIAGWPRPVVSTASPSEVGSGESIVVTVRGTNFAPGATVSFDDPAVSVSGVTVRGCDEIEVTPAGRPRGSSWSWTTRPPSSLRWRWDR